MTTKDVLNAKEKLKLAREALDAEESGYKVVDQKLFDDAKKKERIAGYIVIVAVCIAYLAAGVYLAHQSDLNHCISAVVAYGKPHDVALQVCKAALGA